MAIVLEGPDGAGKTSLARRLQQVAPNLMYYHSGGAPSSDEQENEFIAHQVELAGRSDVVIDRLTCISQQVYRDGRLWEPKLKRGLEDVLMRDHTFIIYCRPSTDHLMSPEKLNWRDVETEEYKQEVIRNQHKFIERYDKLFQTLPHIHYDFSDDFSEVLFPLIAAAPTTPRALVELYRIMVLKTCKTI